MHLLFEVAGYIAGIVIYTLARKRDPINDRDRATVLAGAALGAAIGARALVLFAGKTIVGGLLGGLIGVELIKKWNGITRSTGDILAYPLMAAIAIGRIGCFLTGPIDKTAGLPTALPWGIAMGDSVRRHPVALYEIAFLIVLAFMLRKPMRIEGDRFRVFLSSYLVFRFFIDFLKPEPAPIALRLTSIQWACILGVLYYLMVFSNDSRNATLPFLRRRRVDLHDVLPQD